MSKSPSLLSLPRELRDDILGYLTLPEYVYTSSDKPNTENLHRGNVDANTYVDTRIYLPSRISPNILSVCRQLRHESLQHHTHTLNTQSTSPPTPHDPSNKPTTSSILASRLGAEIDDEAERLNDHSSIRITLEAQRARRGKFGYYVPIRDFLSPRFLALLPLMQDAKSLRIVVWPGFDWWNGARPRAMKIVNGRARIDASGVPDKPDAVSYAIGQVLSQLPAIEHLDVDVLAHVGEISRWDLPDQGWENVQYWLDAPVSREGGCELKSVTRRLAGVWNSRVSEAFYEQSEVRGEAGKWRVKRHGDMRTPTVLSLADPGELDDENVVVDEEFETTY